MDMFVETVDGAHQPERPLSSAMARACRFSRD